MKDNLLVGHSGCKLLLLKKKGSDHIDGVRKFSKDREYNRRLKSQADKQHNFNSKIFKSPDVHSSGEIDGIYYFDMQYIRGMTLSKSVKTMTPREIEKITDNVISYIEENISSSDTMNKLDKHALVHKKLSNIEKSLSIGRRNKLKQTFCYLNNFKWNNLESSPCHGDLTFENILIGSHGIYLIDFLDTFIDTWVSDISKMLQDLIVGWSFREKIISNQITETEKIKMHFFKDVFCRKINNRIRKTDLWEQVYAYLLLDLLRIIPYTNDKKIYEYIERSLLKLTTEVKKGNFYEYINNSMRWPL